ncbi:MED7 protein-domain-containing protein [Amylostereum chailletii]|nr:MED7 protein-domain-containing protein [Amylostereum chailletii]
MDDEQETELRNPFPSPPSLYANYTTQNLNFLALLRERAGSSSDSPDVPDQRELLSDQPDVPEWSLTQLERPRVDWIVEDGHYDVFGDRWFLNDKIPSLAESGGQQLYPEDINADRRPALLSILKSLLVTYSSLLGAALLPPPSSPEVHPEWHRHIEWLGVLTQNIMAAANDLRPVQARVNLELLMQRQLDFRREETKAIHEKCNSLEAQLATLRGVARKSADDITTAQSSESAQSTADVPLLPSLFVDDVLRWAEEF